MQVTFYEIAQAVGAKNNYRQWSDFAITGVEFYSRKIQEGNLFVPLEGMRDGHEFIQTARMQGASATLWKQDKGACSADFPHIVVGDVLKAFQQCAHFYLKKQQPKVVANTGSNGKTTTKDMTAAVLSAQFQVYKTQGNYNNHIGLPYTILHMPDTTEVLVLEMGMDHSGEIEVLAKIAQPEIAAITMIGESHIEHLGSRTGIAQAKLEITTDFTEQNRLIIPENEPLLEEILQNVSYPVQRVGFGPTAQLQAVIEKETATQTQFSLLQYPDILFDIPVLGRYNVNNALIAIQIGLDLGMNPTLIQQGLAQVQLTQNRTQWLKAANGADILSDVYNANPTAMALVLDTVSQLKTKGRKMAVLADMLDLGEFSQQWHVQMQENLSPENIHEVWLYGDQMSSLHEALRINYTEEKVHYYPKTEKMMLMQDLKEALQPEDTVVLKGSNGLGLAEVVEYLMMEEE